jgi:hypothetical protein
MSLSVVAEFLQQQYSVWEFSLSPFGLVAFLVGIMSLVAAYLNERRLKVDPALVSQPLRPAVLKRLKFILAITAAKFMIVAAVSR